MNANPPPPGPFDANVGLRDGPTHSRDHWPSMGVFADPADPISIGQADGKYSEPSRPRAQIRSSIRTGMRSLRVMTR